MKKIIKYIIAIVLIVSMAFVTFGYSFDEEMNNRSRQAISESDFYNKNKIPGGIANKWQFDSCKTAFEVIEKNKTDYIGNELFTINFGNYYQDSETKKEPIEWIILEKKDGMALLMSLKMLDYRNFIDNQKKKKEEKNNAEKTALEFIDYNEKMEKDEPKEIKELRKKIEEIGKKERKAWEKHNGWSEEYEKLANEETKLGYELADLQEKYKSYYEGFNDQWGKDHGSKESFDDIAAGEVNWVDSDLREWLNKDFYNKAFSSKEKASIQELTNGNKTDKVFILKEDEINYYFHTKTINYFTWNEGINSGNPWTASEWTAHSKKIYQEDSNKNENAYFWTRTGNKIMPANNSSKKQVSKSANYLNDKYGVRPCVWVKYDKNITSAQEQRWDEYFKMALEIGLDVAKNKYLGELADYVLPSLN